MKQNLSLRTLKAMNARDPHVGDVLESINDRNQVALWGALEKYAGWVLDSDADHPQLSAMEFAEEIAELIKHRSECLKEDEEEDRKNNWEHS